MRAVWLSSTYYLDPAVEQLKPAEELLFVRALAYCGQAESEGWVSPRGLLALGSRYASRSARTLVAVGLWVEDERGGYRFRTWDHWQESGNDLLRRRRADRERQAKKRATDGAVSRDGHVTVTPTEERREEKEKNGSSSSGISSPVPASSAEPRGPVVSGQGWKLVRQVIPNHHPHATRTALALRAGELLHSGTPPDDVAAALGLWLGKPHLGVGTLPSLVSEVIRNRDGAPPGAGATTAKATGWLALAPSNNPTPRQELT
jgi:hypothetical protein